MELFGHIALFVAGIVPIVSSAFIFFYNRWALRQISEKLQQMREIQTGMRQMLLYPKLYSNSQYGKANDN